MGKTKTALVTGASAGIGRAIAARLCAEGYKVTAVARRSDRLEALAQQTGCTAFQGDVTDADAMGELVSALTPDLLVNNAGIGLAISGLNMVGPEDVARAIATNVTAPIQITQAALPAMKRAGAGHIVNIGSIAGLHTMASALYGAGKTSIHMFSQNLRNELVGTGIRVTEICPGRVTTEFYDHSTGNIEKTSLGDIPIRALDPEDIAAAVAYAVSAPAHVNIATIELLPTDQAVGGIKAIPSTSVGRE